MTDFRTPTRAAIVSALKASPDVVAVIPKASVYGGTVPATRTFPFSRIGGLIGSPFRATGLVSSAFRLTVQGFTKDVTNTAGTVILPAEDNAALIGSAFESALDLADLPLSLPGYRARIIWLQTSILIDGDEASAWMATSTFNVEISG